MNLGVTEPDRAGAPARARARSTGRRHLVLLSESFFARRSPVFVALAALLLIAVIFSADVATGRVLSPSLFYLLPVALMTWRLGGGAGITIGALSSVAWTISDVISDAYAAGSLAPYWNAAVRFGVLAVVASLLATIRATMQAERDLADEAIGAADELRALNDVKDTLLHAVSHDLRGAITAIVGSAQSLTRRDHLGLSRDDEESLFDGILQSGRKLDRMVADLLDLERLDRGVVEPDRAPTDLGALVARVVDEALYAERHPIHVEVLEPIEMDVDGGTVERIVENLLVNAVKHTPPGTPIHVRAERRDGGAEIAVEDEGPGVPDEIKAIVFEPFRQGTGVRSGAGIGLSLAAKFAQLHGGRAWVEDRPGGGAAFRVFLPGETRRAPASSSLPRTARV
jgi:signal transduction histidine kinase